MTSNYAIILAQTSYFTTSANLNIKTHTRMTEARACIPAANAGAPVTWAQ